MIHLPILPKVTLLLPESATGTSCLLKLGSAKLLLPVWRRLRRSAICSRDSKHSTQKEDFRLNYNYVSICLLCCVSLITLIFRVGKTQKRQESKFRISKAHSSIIHENHSMQQTPSLFLDDGRDQTQSIVLPRSIQISFINSFNNSNPFQTLSKQD